MKYCASNSFNRAATAFVASLLPAVAAEAGQYPVGYLEHVTGPHFSPAVVARHCALTIGTRCAGSHSSGEERQRQEPRALVPGHSASLADGRRRRTQ
jgi:hypothetical protein